MSETVNPLDTDLRLAIRAEFGEAVSVSNPDERGMVFVTQTGANVSAMVEEIIRLRTELSTPERTSLSTVQDLHREAVQDKERVTRELEEAKWEIANSAQHQRDELAALQQQLATARSDALREAKEKVEKMHGIHSGGFEQVDKLMVLSLLGGAA